LYYISGCPPPRIIDNQRETPAVLLVDDPTVPTTFPPGSEGKLCVLEARRALGLDLFHEQDALGCRQIAPAERVNKASLRSQRERRLIGLLTNREQSAKKLAGALAVPLRQVHAVLTLLFAAGIVQKGPAGYKLRELQL
jgi:hypothetical protein